MPKAGSDDPAATLDRPGVHEGWELVFRSDANERFFEEAFDVVVREPGLPAGATILDAGCGAGAHTIRLARRGFHVRSVDFSSSVLEAAAANVRPAGLADRVTLQREDLLHLSLADASFDAVLCWGCSCTCPRSSARSPSWPASSGPAAAGAEYELMTPDGVLLIRHANVDWLVSRFRGLAFSLLHRFAGQFTELYSRTSSGPAFGNILILRKTGAGPDRAAGPR